MKDVEYIKCEIKCLYEIQCKMESRKDILEHQLEILEIDIEQLSDYRGGLLLFLEKFHGVKPE